MLIEGEKWACDACVRGHRVSNCQHSERPLQHINKKGRPVSQCSHCRTMRKSRSAHVRCDCGGLKGHSKGACPNDGDTQADNCCCSHGSRCTCAVKKEHLDPVPESDSDDVSSNTIPTPKPRRPRAHTAQSENNLTIFTNGHHKPVHKHNNMAHKCGMPYVVPRAHSIHGQSPSSFANRSVDNLPHTSTIDALHSESQIKDSIVSAQQEQRMVKSEHASPLLNSTTTLDQLNGQLPPLDLSNLPTDYNNFYAFDAYGGAVPELEQPMFSAGMSAASIDWSLYDGLDFNNDNFAASSYSQAASFNGFDFSSIDQPALTTTSTSGEISEVEDFCGVTDNVPSLSNLANGNQYGSDIDTSEFGGDVDSYRLSTASSYIGVPQMQMLASNEIDVLGMDDFMKGAPTGFLPPAPPAESMTMPTYAPDMKNSQPLCFDNDTNFPLPVTENTTESFWINDFTAANIIGGNTENRKRGSNIWIQ
ncbi:copper fist dna binding domain protein [Rutstroemia sp. NJR-2017a BBW]|nr:copper fist dna binding domain protein [Rutstroemia sp. NJR-2017a BBW]